VYACVCVRERDGWTDKLDSVLSPIQTRWDVQCNATGLNVKLKHLWGREHVIEELSQQACPSLSLLFFVFLFLTPFFFFIFARSLMWRKLIGGRSVQPTAVLEIFLLQFVLLGEIAVLARLCGRYLTSTLLLPWRCLWMF